ncbi:DMT family transporter [Alisedimentitalea sp. MJ-SS2]|uniref:DMT family transporter n=1 Tax=Aliisedimentitalea sp. MJ-SS2 TaxID=3049795 RepID=UPI00290F6AD9|nr:DMT family transporter [Alisedimentitalea sp. MJ-SS2]MDU8927529.1 DMT family transporter [Alisedimentitalea sp. MJ-SS2]
MIGDRPICGILLMLGFCIVAPMADAVAKILGQSVPLGQLIFIRFAVQVVLLLPFIALTGRPWRIRGRVLWLVILRTFMHIFGIGLMIAALQYLPLADAVAISFVMPFILLVLGKRMLGEEVGTRRILASLIGFAGTLLIVQPSFTAVGWAALLPLGVALNFAFFILVTRQIAKETDPFGLQTTSGLMAMVILAPFLLIGLPNPLGLFDIIFPNSTEWALLLAIGTLGTLAHLLMTMSLRHAPAATLAPLQYIEIPMAALLGWMVFADWPGTMAMSGILITMAAGLYIVLTEGRAEEQPSAPAPDRAEPSAPRQNMQPAE